MIESDIKLCRFVIPSQPSESHEVILFRNHRILMGSFNPFLETKTFVHEKIQHIIKE